MTIRKEEIIKIKQFDYFLMTYRHHGYTLEDIKFILRKHGFVDIVDKFKAIQETVKEIFAELNEYKFEKPKLKTFIIRITEPDLIQLKQKFLKGEK